MSTFRDLLLSYRLLSEDSEEISSELLSLDVVPHLLYAMGNTEHSESQIQASLALEVHCLCKVDLTYVLHSTFFLH